MENERDEIEAVRKNTEDGRKMYSKITENIQKKYGKKREKSESIGTK